MPSVNIRTLALIALLIAPLLAHAQIPGLPKAKADAGAETQAKPTSIAIADIPKAVERDQRFVQDVLQRSASVSGAPSSSDATIDCREEREISGWGAISASTGSFS